MMLADDDYGRRALDFVERLQKARTAAEIQQIVTEALASFGLTAVTSWTLPGPGQRAEDGVDFNTRPMDYIEHYVDKRLVEVDPVLTHLRQTFASFTWNDLRSTGHLNKAEKSIIDEAREFGADDGLIIPIRTLTGSVGIFSPCGSKPDLSQRARSSLEIIGTYSFIALQKAALNERRGNQKPHQRLTPREREVMTWVAVGKSDDEIGEILNIARDTVTKHVENAKVKLDATKRTYAVVQAIRLGEINL